MDTARERIGESVIFERLQRDTILKHLNPYRMSHLQAIISLFTCCKTLLSKEDLIEVKWKRQHKFTRAEDFVLRDDMRYMSVKVLRKIVESAQPCIFDGFPLWGLKMLPLTSSGQDIFDAFPELSYIPGEVYTTYRGGREVLRKISTAEGREILRTDRELAEGFFELACQAGLDLTIIQSLMGNVNLSNTDALHLAATYGHLDIVRFLVEEGHADVNQIDREGLTPLLAAAERAQIDVVRYLIDLGVDIHAEDIEGTGIFIIACESSHIEFVDQLLQIVDLDVTATDRLGHTAIHFSVMNGDIPMVKYLVNDLGVPFPQDPPDADGETGGSLLQVATGSGSIEMFEYLVEEFGLDPKEKDVRGCTLIFDAARRGFDALIDLLVEKYGLNPAAEDNEGCTAIFDAITEGHLHTFVKLVDSYGLDPFHRDHMGQDVLFFAASVGDEYLYHLLEETYWFDTDLVDQMGMTSAEILNEALGVASDASWETEDEEREEDEESEEREEREEDEGGGGAENETDSGTERDQV